MWFRLPALLLIAVSLTAAPQRIISASPSITEMLYALGLADRVVGVTSFCHWPPEVRDKPKIGSYLNPNLEQILAMRPDLVVTLEEHGDLVGQLERVGLNVLALQHNDLAGIYDSLRLLGDRAGVADRAERLVERIQAELAAVQRQAAGRPKRKTIFLVGRTPGAIQDMVAVGKGAFLNELIEIAGGRNIFRETLAYYPRASKEEILAQQPEVILDMGDMSETDEVSQAHKAAVERLWRREFPNLPAVREGRVFAVAEDRFVVPGPRVAEAARLLLEMIHPETAGEDSQ